MAKGKHRIVVTTGANDRIVAICTTCDKIVFDDYSVQVSLKRINKLARHHKKGGIFITEADIVNDLKTRATFYPEGYHEKLFVEFDVNSNASDISDVSDTKSSY